MTDITTSYAAINYLTDRGYEVVQQSADRFQINQIQVVDRRSLIEKAQQHAAAAARGSSLTRNAQAL